MKALISAFALLAFVGASTVPYVAHAQGQSSTPSTSTTNKSAPAKKSTAKKTAKKKSATKKTAKKTSKPSSTSSAPKTM